MSRHQFLDKSDDGRKVNLRISLVTTLPQAFVFLLEFLSSRIEAYIGILIHIY